jgi:hypothetical protein
MRHEYIPVRGEVEEKDSHGHPGAEKLGLENCPQLFKWMLYKRGVKNEGRKLWPIVISTGR